MKTGWQKTTIFSQSAQAGSALQRQHDAIDIDLWYYFSPDLKFQRAACTSISTQTSKKHSMYLQATVELLHFHSEYLGWPTAAQSSMYSVTLWPVATCTVDRCDTKLQADVGAIMGNRREVTEVRRHRPDIDMVLYIVHNWIYFHCMHVVHV